MTALSESFCLTSIHNVLSWPISTSLLFSWIRKPILDTWVVCPIGVQVQWCLITVSLFAHSLASGFPNCSQVQGSSVGKYMYIPSGFNCSNLLLFLMNLGQVRSHEAWPCDLQLAHQNFTCSSLEQSAVRCSLPQVPQVVGWSHSAAR